MIKAISTAVPENKISQEEHYSILESANGMSREEKLRLRRIYSRSGIEFRHSVLDEFGREDKPENILFHPAGVIPSATVSKRMELYELHAANLCVKAVEECFDMLPELKATDITHIITFSCTGMFAPGVDIQLVERLGMQRNVERTCVNFMGCYAAINALKVAYHISRSQPDAIVLLAGVELCSLHYQKSNEQNQVVANALFSDGAAAAIVTTKNLQKRLPQPDLLLRNFYAEFEQTASEDMVWRIGNVGFDLRLTTEVPNIVRNNIKLLTEKLFAKTKLSKNDIDYYAIHPGGRKILEACEEALEITPDQNSISYEVLRNYGNMSSVTVLFVLKEYLRRLSQDDIGKNILACAFGPGITMESMIAAIA
ncbi:MAG: type III polyketide synthase [Flavipsychrobacter sp.]